MNDSKKIGIAPVKGDEWEVLQALLERVFRMQREQTRIDIEKYLEREREKVAA